MRVAPVLACLASGCLSVGGGVTFNASLDDAPTRRVGGVVQIGNVVEIVENELVGQLAYIRDIGPLGDRSSALGAWGGRLTRTQGGGLPGLYVHGAYGQNDDATEPDARSVIAGAGVAYTRFDATARGKAWTSIQVGLVYHRSRQETVDSNAVGHFIGLELSTQLGFDILGPMFATSADDNAFD